MNAEMDILKNQWRSTGGQKAFNPTVSSCILGLEISYQGRRDVGAVGTFAT